MPHLLTCRLQRSVSQDWLFSEPVVFEWACVSGDALSTRTVLVGPAVAVDGAVVLSNIMASFLDSQLFLRQRFVEEA